MPGPCQQLFNFGFLGYVSLDYVVKLQKPGFVDPFFVAVSTAAIRPNQDSRDVIKREETGVARAERMGLADRLAADLSGNADKVGYFRLGEVNVAGFYFHVRF